MNETKETKETKETNTNEQFEALTKELQSYTSLKAVFLRGIVYGVATALGATVVAAVVVSFLYRVTGPILKELPLTSSVLEALEAQSFTK